MAVLACTRSTKFVTYSQKSQVSVTGFNSRFPARVSFKRNTRESTFSGNFHCRIASTSMAIPTTTTDNTELPSKQLTSPLTVTLTEDGDVVSSSGAVILQGLSTKNDNNAAITSRDDGTALILSASSSIPTSSLDVSLGTLAVRRYLALGRTSLWWMSPYWGAPSNKNDAIPAETQFLLLELFDGTCALMLPLLANSGTFRATLRSEGDKNRSSSSSLAMRVESGAATITATEFKSALYIATGSDPFELVARGVATAASLSGTAKPRSSKAVPPIAEKFMWCTWDAYYSTISAEGLKLGLASLVAGGTPPRGVIIDDGWQVTDVDPMYRKGEKEEEYPLLSTTATQNNRAIINNSTDAKVKSRVDSHEMNVEEAAAELLAGPGDDTPDMLKGEHEIITEATSSSNIMIQNGMSMVTKLRRGLSHIISLVEAALLHVGKYVLDSAHSDSFIIKAFTALATGPMKATLLRFYAHATDHTRRLSSIQANAKFALPDSGATGVSLAAPGGDLSTVVSSIKKEYGVEYVYAWHAMHGFWGGLGVDDPEMTKYNAKLLMPVPTQSILEVDPAISWVQPVVAGVSLPLDPVKSSLHHDMHEYLASCGVDGVKVDVQGTIGLAGGSANGGPGGPALAAAYHESLEASVAKHFPGNHLINCMCHSTEDLYNFTDSNLCRVSDDFYPRRPASHTSHIANCSYNTLFMGEIVIPDYDMFHSKHPAAFLHATARAISGGPIYVSDKPNHHDFDLLKRLVFKDGSVMRCMLPGRPTVDCLFENVSHNNSTALKIWNVNEVNGVVGVFNVQGSSFSRRYRSFRTHDTNPPTLKAVVKPADVPTLMTSLTGTTSTGMFVLYSDRSGAMKLVDNALASGIEVDVAPNGGCDVVTICPALSFPASGNGNGSDNINVDGKVVFAAVGLVNMLNAGGAVMSCELDTSSLAISVSMRLRGAGQLLAFSSQRPRSVEFGGKKIQFEYDVAVSALKFTIPENETGVSLAERVCFVRF